MGIDNKSEQLMIQLTRETYSNVVKWEVKDVPFNLQSGTEDIFPLYLEAKYKNTIVGLFQRSYKSFYDEHDFYWVQDMGFCILDEEERIVWQHDQTTPALINLFDAAREQASGINGILDDLLNN